MDVLVAAKVRRSWDTDTRDMEERTWECYFGDWVKVQHLSANGYWQPLGEWDRVGRVEATAKVKTISEGGVYYFEDWPAFRRFLEYYLGVEDIEELSKEECGG